MTLLTALAEFFKKHHLPSQFLIAYSGGLDSHVLLNACAELRSQFPLQLRAIHINHGLNIKANDWSNHCARICKELQIPYLQHVIDIAVKNNVEEVARKKRYAVLASYLNANETLLTAHHQDDQAETLLLQLLRGAGVRGLAAMPEVKPFGYGHHARPLLSFSRACLKAYAIAQGLDWLEDHSNQDERFTRNFIRHRVLPLLATRWTTVAKTLSRSAKHCAEAERLLEKYCPNPAEVMTDHAAIIKIDDLLPLKPEQQKLRLRTWFRKHNIPMPGEKKLQTILSCLLTAATDASPCVAWQDVELRRYQNELYLMSALKTREDESVFSWDTPTSLMLPFGSLHLTKEQNGGLNPDFFPLTVRFRRGGERLILLNRGRHTLKKLFQEWKIPPWQRHRLPLIFKNDSLIAVPGYGIDPGFIVKKDEVGYKIVFKWHGKI